MKPISICIGLGLAAWSLAAADSGAAVSYPAGYRKWVHVKTTLVGPQHPRFASNGGIHHFNANPQALEGYKSGKFPDGAVLIDDLLEVKEADGVTSEAARRRVAVMVKDAARFGDTGGWGFEIFKGDGSVPSLKAEGKAACFACHGKQKDSDSVFTQFRK
ncbi:MAG: cytochrome P460 family protein [Acidobacteriota bacterium]